MSVYLMTTEEEFILGCAFRYALGAMSTAPSIISEALEKRWKKLSPDLKKMVKKEIRESIKLGKAGMDMDVKTWEKVLSFPD